MPSRDDAPVHESEWRLSIYDIANGDGIAKVTLRSGVQITGKPSKSKSEHATLFMYEDRGWHVIDWTEIAAISGAPAPRER